MKPTYLSAISKIGIPTVRFNLLSRALIGTLLLQSALSSPVRSQPSLMYLAPKPPISAAAHMARARYYADVALADLLQAPNLNPGDAIDASDLPGKVRTLLSEMTAAGFTAEKPVVGAYGYGPNPVKGQEGDATLETLQAQIKVFQDYVKAHPSSASTMGLAVTQLQGFAQPPGLPPNQYHIARAVVALVIVRHDITQAVMRAQQEYPSSSPIFVSFNNMSVLIKEIHEEIGYIEGRDGYTLPLIDE